jgi:hypothetical protein
MNDAGAIVGRYEVAGVPHGFLLTDGLYTTVTQVPGSISWAALGIKNHGDIVGGWTAPDNTRHGFLLANEDLTLLDSPGATLTTSVNINDSGQIVGNFILNGVDHAFIATVGTAIPEPGSYLLLSFGLLVLTINRGRLRCQTRLPGVLSACAQAHDIPFNRAHQ